MRCSNQLEANWTYLGFYIRIHFSIKKPNQKQRTLVERKIWIPITEIKEQEIELDLLGTVL